MQRVLLLILLFLSSSCRAELETAAFVVDVKEGLDATLTHKFRISPFSSADHQLTIDLTGHDFFVKSEAFLLDNDESVIWRPLSSLINVTRYLLIMPIVASDQLLFRAGAEIIGFLWGKEQYPQAGISIVIVPGTHEDTVASGNNPSFETARSMTDGSSGPGSTYPGQNRPILQKPNKGGSGDGREGAEHTLSVFPCHAGKCGGKPCQERGKTSNEEKCRALDERVLQPVLDCDGPLTVVCSPTHKGFECAASIPPSSSGDGIDAEQQKQPKKSFVCRAGCGKNFTQSSNRNRHERIHTGDKSYACKFCDKRFFQSSNKGSHERTHTGEKPYACKKGCGKNFVRSDVRDSHERTHLGKSGNNEKEGDD